MKVKKHTIPLVLTLLLIICGINIYAEYLSMKRITSTGKIITEGVNVFWDEDLTQEVTSIYWGALEPGQEATETVWIQNTGNVNIVLYLKKENWSSPEANQYLQLTWNYTGEEIDPDNAILVYLNLSVFSGITGVKDFSFDIIISIEE